MEISYRSLVYAGSIVAGTATAMYLLASGKSQELSEFLQVTEDMRRMGVDICVGMTAMMTPPTLVTIINSYSGRKSDS